MKNRIVLLLLVSGCMFACKSGPEHVKVVSGPQIPERHLRGESLQLFEQLSHPSEIYCFDSLLFLLEISDEQKMVVCDPVTKQVVNHLIPKGRGPGEQLGTSGFAYHPLKRCIYSFDIALRKILEIDRDSVCLPDYKPTKTYDFPSEMVVLSAEVLNDSSFVVTGNFPDCRAATFTWEGGIQKYGVSPDLNLPLSDMINQAYSGKVKNSPSGDKFVLASLFADQLEIFNLKDGASQLFVKGPEVFEPRYTIEKVGSLSVLAHAKDEICGYADVHATEDRIYALYSGKMRDQGKEWYCDRIRVFSWEGEYLMDYVLDRQIVSFCLDQQNQCIYGIASEPGAEIYKFEME